MRHFHLLLDDELYERLRLFAFQLNRNMNKMVREVLKQYLEGLLKKENKK